MTFTDKLNHYIVQQTSSQAPLLSGQLPLEILFHAYLYMPANCDKNIQSGIKRLNNAYRESSTTRSCLFRQEIDD